jgi:3-isopropylmalate dehydrogenase
MAKEPQKEEDQDASDTFTLTALKAERLTRLAFRLARERRRPLCIVDMPGLPATGRLFEQAASKAAKDHPSVTCRHLPADRFIEEWMRNPAQFSAALCGPLAGPAVSGAAAALMGGRGILPGAFLGDNKPILYQPAHGPEPEIAGKDTADPIGMILCAAMMLRLSLNLANEAECVETAVANVLEAGWRTADLTSGGSPKVGTEAIGKLIAEQVDTVGAVMNPDH